MPKHTGWMHTVGGRDKAKGEHVHAARKVLGELKNQLALGKIKSGSMRKLLDDGTLIEVAVSMGIPSVRITAGGGKKRKKRSYETFAYLADTENVYVVQLCDYESDDYEDAPMTETKFRMEFVKKIPIGVGEDLIGIAIDHKRERVFVSSYNPSTSSDRIIMIDSKLNEIANDFRPPGAFSSFRPYNLTVNQGTGWVYSSAAFADTDSTNIRRLDPDTGQFYNTPYFFPDAVVDLVFSGNTESIYSLVDVASGDIDRLSVMYTVNDENSITDNYSLSGEVFGRRLDVSSDARFVCYTGFNFPDPFPQAGDQFDFVAVFDLVNGVQVAKIHGMKPYHVNISPDGKHIVVNNNENANPWLWIYETEKMGLISNFFTLPDLTQDGVQIVNDVISAPPLATHICENKFAPDGKRIFCTSLNEHPTGYKFLCIDVENASIVNDVEIVTTLKLGPVSILIRRKPDLPWDN